MKSSTALIFLIALSACGKNSPTSAASLTHRQVSNEPVVHETLTRSKGLRTESGLGFFEVSDESIPDAVQASADSVFELRVLAAGTNGSLKAVDVSLGQGAKAKAEINAMSSDVFDQSDKLILLRQIEQCETYQDLEQQKNCIVSFDIRKSTGFTAGTASTLWTNAHVIEGAMSFVQKLAGVEQQRQLSEKHRLAIFIFNRNGKLVLDPYLDVIKIKTIPVATSVAIARNSFYAEDSDAMSLEMSKSLGAPLKFAKQQLVRTQVIFTLGYPACTGCDPSAFQVSDKNDFLSRSPYPNSTGIGLKVSMGKVLDNESVQSFFETTAATMEQWNLTQMMFNSSDSNHGNSGGPVLNEQGDVVAIHAGGKSALVNGSLKRVSRTVILPEFNRRE